MVSPVTPPPKPPKARHKRNAMVGITLVGQMPALEHCKEGHSGYVWRLWLSYDDRYENGMYLRLGNDGEVTRFVVIGGKIRKVDTIKEGN